MLPLFNELITFINHKTKNQVNFIREGFYWYDKSIIKAFDISGNLIKIARINIDNNFNIEINLYSNQFLLLESWADTVNRCSENLLNLEKESLKLINESISKCHNKNIAILSSGGKDSSVVTHLVKKCVSNPQIIFNNTSLDCADTYRHIKKETNLTIINPKEGFYTWRKRLNFIPTRFARACCNIFKESAMVNYLDKDIKYLFFMGMRNQESSTRSNYGDEWKNIKWQNRDWNSVLPIRKWNEIDIWLYILKENISINPKYKKGYSRVGCAIACPFYTKFTWALDEYWYPTMTNRWKNILREDFNKNNKDLIMNCTEDEYLICWNGGVFREEPTDEVINQFARRSNLSVDVAKNYFGHECSNCNKRIKDKNTIAMNFKFNGRNTRNIYCKKHLMAKLDIDAEEWSDYIQLFKQQDCELF